MNLIYHAGPEPVKIPSIRDLARQMNAAKSTVQLAYDKMIDEGFLIPRQGIGTFSNPQQNFFMFEKPLPLIGIKLGSGDQFFYPFLMQQDIECYMAALSRRKCNVRFLNCTCNSIEEFESEIQNSGVDAVICQNVPADYVRAAHRMVFTVSIGEPVSGVNSLEYGFSKFVQAILRTLQERQVPERVLFLSNWRARVSLYQPLLRQFGENLLVEETFSSLQDFFDMLERHFSAPNPPGAVIAEPVKFPVIRTFLTRLGISPERCLLIALDHQVQGQKGISLYPLNLHRKMIPEAVKLVFSALGKKKKAAPEHKIFESGFAGGE